MDTLAVVVWGCINQPWLAEDVQIIALDEKWPFAARPTLIAFISWHVRHSITIGCVHKASSTTMPGPMPSISILFRSLGRNGRWFDETEEAAGQKRDHFGARLPLRRAHDATVEFQSEVMPCVFQK